MQARRRHALIVTLAIATFSFAGNLRAAAQTTPPQPAPGCPPLGWAEGLGRFLTPDAKFPTSDTAEVPTPDCNFHEWSWEAFVWATALIKDPKSGATVPRFMTLPTPPDLLKKSKTAGARRFRPLTLAARSLHFRGQPGFSEGEGAIVEADGNMLVAQNGYPVYASVHMDPLYFKTAQQNLITTGAYQKGSPSGTFPVGAAVFKATWQRLAPGQKPPAGTYTTQAQVPVLETKVTPGEVTIQPVPGKFTTVTVALIGLHVVGHTANHPEFLWGTFEHKLNSPATPDNTFTPSASTSDPKSFTLYKANTPYSQVNQAVTPPQLNLNTKTQTLTPITNVVLENQTGGENQPGGVGNIEVLNSQAQSYLGGLKSPQSGFASYNLIGTVWMLPNSYNL
ncbi:MAG TPA: hypothetical protein VE224_02165, partial [Pseudolabrys sp.]|nr:hypothetical protein [Pseudolabrys sp.]